MSYSSDYYDSSFSSIGDQRFDAEFLKYFDRANGWGIEYALIKSQRNISIMRKAVGAVLELCKAEYLSPIYERLIQLKILQQSKF
jgi:hypothetical protein